ncbi:hypothetical protein IW140_005755 [Coemansia sp. RSA 1813]|nr:hypothetical protein EV178_002179 [Coemansia sp. RSA 1646]KAJ1767243.1 hypothetical protein LPJ74_005485 [Coemansia sp. RSA 1843]KAJ2090321.1 hypothetical protein IW138_002747 [Coemansia sp. RSA 986]KAJ2215511.1 hypothetical protein EV179_002104 [Coemansia sp. RSA 487]KAJ2564417.1 hypothetical protein IW140_005755 [Coemansia sp. RSA 1813]
MASIPPSQTLYIRNLNDKIQKDVLKRTLYEACVGYGRILDIVALKTIKMRGQAFIVFEDIATATVALRQLNGRAVFGRAMNVEYALSKSNIVAQQDGTLKYGEERTHMSAKERKRLLGITDGSSAATAKRGPEDEAGDQEQEEDGHLAKKQAVGENSDSDAEDSDGSSDVGPLPPSIDSNGDRRSADRAGAEDEQMPSQTLFVSNIPESVSAEMLGGLFQQYVGFREVRLVAGKGGVAFIDYESIESATAARKVLDGFKLSADQAMKVDFSR